MQPDCIYDFTSFPQAKRLHQKEKDIVKFGEVIEDDVVELLMSHRQSLLLELEQAENTDKNTEIDGKE